MTVLTDRSLRAMVVIQQLVERLRTTERGATAVEYGMLVALIAAVIVTIVKTLGTQINTAFTTISGQL